MVGRVDRVEGEGMDGRVERVDRVEGERGCSIGGCWIGRLGR